MKPSALAPWPACFRFFLENFSTISTNFHRSIVDVQRSPWVLFVQLDMKKIFALFALFATALGPLFGQKIQEISIGAGYKNQSFVRLADDFETQSDNSAWDIAFTVVGLQDAGIHINEASGSIVGLPQPTVRLFDAMTDDFSATPDPAALEDIELFNSEKTWLFGAFNENRDPSNQFDFGWGKYNPAINQVIGTKVYVIQLRDGSYRKIKIEAITIAGYTFRYANLDGSNETTKTLSKADFPGKTLAYFSFTTQKTVEVEPQGAPFDFLYTRYSTPLWDSINGEFIPYILTGILSGRDVLVAKATGINPATVQFSDWKDSLKTDLATIGYDWKTLAGTTWDIPSDRVYFLKTADQHLWKIQFIDFEGLSTGVAVFEKTDLGTVSAVENAAAPLASYDIFPNPAPSGGETNLLFSAKKPGSAAFYLTDALGKTVQNGKLQINAGLNATTLQLGGLPSGVYQLSLLVDGHFFGKTILIQQ